MVFPWAVAADEANLVAADDAGGEVADDVLEPSLVALVDILDFEDVLAAGAVLLEGDVGALDVGASELGGL